uniref:Secreted protein n=1 Tax=Terrapene triunguis TaxID=2587831 RepID=A0A674K193_9SAUR
MFLCVCQKLVFCFWFLVLWSSAVASATFHFRLHSFLFSSCFIGAELPAGKMLSRSVESSSAAQPPPSSCLIPLYVPHPRCQAPPDNAALCLRLCRLKLHRKAFWLFF